MKIDHTEFCRMYDEFLTLRIYAAYVTSDDLLEVANRFDIPSTTALGYVCQEYQSAHVERHVYKLGLNPKTITQAFDVMWTSWVMLEMDTRLKSSQFTREIHDALGYFCTDRVVATSLLYKLYTDYCVGHVANPVSTHDSVTGSGIMERLQ